MPTKDPRWAHCVDSAPFGSNHGVECIVAFFGSDRVLFGTDTLFDKKDGSHFIPVTISDVEGAVHYEAPRVAIFKAMPANFRNPNLISTGIICRVGLLPRRFRQVPSDCY